MNKFLTAIFTFLMLFSFSAIIAQSECGTTTQTQYDARERLFQNRIDAANDQGATSRDVTVYVPIKFHIVSQTDGTSGISEAQILALLCQVNDKYADQDMVFYINYPFSYISNTTLFNEPGSNGGLNQISWNWDDNSLNLFVCNSTGDPGSGAYYSGPFPGFPYEHIIMKKSQFSGPTASHEIGHFFSLAHPFFGWGQGDDTGWDPAIHGNPVGTYAPVGPPFILNEKQDQSNCQSAADGICDTPPDYFFAHSPGQSGCVWSGGAMDPNGDIVHPMEDNIMSYFNGCSDQFFSPDQKTAIRNDFNSSARAYLRHSYIPPHDEITEAPELLEPINNETTAGYNTVTFDWEAPSGGAQRYLLEIDQQATFAFLPKRYIVGNGSSIDIEDLSPDVKYYWRVTPYNDGNTCDLKTSTVEVFRTGESVSTKNIAEVNSWSVAPNPVRQNEILNIQMEADQAFDANIRLYTMTGQLVKSVSKHNFAIGTSNYNMNISGVGTGMYIVSIHSDKGVVNKKIVITN